MIGAIPLNTYLFLTLKNVYTRKIRTAKKNAKKAQLVLECYTVFVDYLVETNKLAFEKLYKVSICKPEFDK
jgi:hypothetical protein